MVESARSVPAKLAASLALVLALATAARATTYGDIEITVLSEARNNSNHGYFVYLFLVTNHAEERAHTVTLSVPDERGYMGSDHLRELRRTVQVGGNETVRVELLQPDAPPLDGEGARVWIDGSQQEHSLPLRLHSARSAAYRYSSYRYYSPGPIELLILKSRGINKEFPLLAPRPPAGMFGMSGGGMSGGHAARPALGSEAAELPGMAAIARKPGTPPKPKLGFPPQTTFQPAEPIETWSHNWLAYSRYDGIIVTGGDLKAMAPEARIAIWQYVETGGTLLVLGEADLRGLSVSATRNIEDGWRAMECGFGQCIVSPVEDCDRWKAGHFQLLTTLWTETPKPWEGMRNSYDANERFPLVADIGVPIKGLFVLMFLFAVMIGPVNFFVLARRKRRIWLLWTTPVISFLTCLAVFGYMLLSEGWQGRLRTETFTLLDERTQRATTIGWTGVYSPLTPSDGLHFSYETEVIPQRVGESRKEGIHSCTVDWSRDQHFASGWVEARVPAHFKVRKSKIHRERVNIRREDDGKLSMDNWLGAGIRRFTYVDAKGQIYTAENIAAGAPASLTAKNLPEVPVPAPTMRQMYLTSNWLVGTQGIAAAPQRYLPRNSYFAEVDDSPFLEDALLKAGTRDCRALVMGLLKEQGK